MKQGEKLIKFDKVWIESKGLQTTCILVLTNGDEFPNAKFITEGSVVQNKNVICEFD